MAHPSNYCTTGVLMKIFVLRPELDCSLGQAFDQHAAAAAQKFPRYLSNGAFGQIDRLAYSSRTLLPPLFALG
jgi:hypothetical protein